MKKMILLFASALLSLGVKAQMMVYNPTSVKLTSGELNQKTEPTLIAIKNLSKTNCYYFVANTGVAPYSKADFSNEAVFVWTPVEEGVSGNYYLMKLDGTYMQKNSPAAFGTVENAAKFTTTNPTSKGSGTAYFNGDGDSQGYINGSDDANLVRFVTDGKWINVQNGDNGTPLYNTGTGGWTIHYVYAVEGSEGEGGGTTDPAPDPDPELAGKVYYIQWKNTGANHVTENRNKSLSVASKNTSKMQFWEFVPTGKANCYYIKNVVSKHYIGSCNMTPSSASRVTISAEPVEYYVGATAATSGEIAGCYYFSSTDCDGYSNESAGPRALNKDGASDFIITWQAGTSREGSYWKLVETTDVYVAPEPVQHTALAKKMNIYFNPCGMVGGNFLTSAKVHGEGALDPIVYEATNKPSSWHVPYPHDYGKVARGAAFDISIVLKNAADADLKANAYFDWNADGEFEATVPIILNGTAGAASVEVPEEAAEEPVRMRIRINSNGLDLAEDDVDGFAYDFHIAVVEPQEGRAVSIGVNVANRGTVTLSDKAERYAYGATLTAKATPKGNATFVCWREEGVVVSTDAEYTFTVDHNVKLKAYFTANTDPDTGVATLGADQAGQVIIGIEGDKLVAQSSAEVCAIDLYTVDAALVARAEGNILPIGGISQGTYIVRVTTADGYKNVKVYLNK